MYTDRQITIFLYKFIYRNRPWFLYINRKDCDLIYMGKLKIVGKTSTKDSITRTIRMSGDCYDKIALIAEKEKISFNNVVNQLLEYGLKNIG